MHQSKDEYTVLNLTWDFKYKAHFHACMCQFFLNGSCSSNLKTSVPRLLSVISLDPIPFPSDNVTQAGTHSRCGPCRDRTGCSTSFY